MSVDPIVFIADLLDERMRTQTLWGSNIRPPRMYISRWISAADTEFPSISIFSHQQTHKPQGFSAKHYLNIRQVRVELRTDNVEELHKIEEEIQYIVGDNSNRPQTEKYPVSGIEHIKLNSSVDVFEQVTDVIVYRRSILIDCYSQYSY